MNGKITESDMRLLVSKNLKRFRALQNYSQLSLALDAGLASNYINDIEKCKKSASLVTIAKLSSALKIQPHLFFMPEDLPDNTRIYVDAFRDDLQRYVSNWTGPYLSSGNEKKNKK